MQEDVLEIEKIINEHTIKTDHDLLFNVVKQTLQKLFSNKEIHEYIMSIIFYKKKVFSENSECQKQKNKFKQHAIEILKQILKNIQQKKEKGEAVDNPFLHENSYRLVFPLQVLGYSSKKTKRKELNPSEDIIKDIQENILTDNNFIRSDIFNYEISKAEQGGNEKFTLIKEKDYDNWGYYLENIVKVLNIFSYEIIESEKTKDKHLKMLNEMDDCKKEIIKSLNAPPYYDSYKTIYLFYQENCLITPSTDRNFFDPRITIKLSEKYNKENFPKSTQDTFSSIQFILTDLKNNPASKSSLKCNMDTTKNKNEKNIVNFNDIGDDKEAIKLETGITILMFKEKRALFGICNKNGELIIQRKNVEKILLFFLDHQNQFVPSDKVKKETRVGHLSKKISYINTLLNPNLSKDGIKIIESGKNEYYGYYRFRVRGGQEK